MELLRDPQAWLSFLLLATLEVMVAAIVVSMPVMMAVSAAVGRFIEQHPTVKILALVFLAAIGCSLIAESWHLETNGYGIPSTSSGFLCLCSNKSSVLKPRSRASAAEMYIEE